MNLAGQLDQFVLVGKRRICGPVSSLFKGLELRVAIPRWPKSGLSVMPVPDFQPLMFLMVREFTRNVAVYKDFLGHL